jgi:hypothetical protein
MSEGDVAEAEGFLSEMLVCFPVLGLCVFEKPSTGVIRQQVFFLKGSGSRTATFALLRTA